MRGVRARRGVLLVVALVALVAALVMGGCSVLIGVAGDPVVVDDLGDASIEAGRVEGGGEIDAAKPGDAASADETDTGDGGDAGDQDADDGAAE